MDLFCESRGGLPGLTRGRSATAWLRPATLLIFVAMGSLSLGACRGVTDAGRSGTALAVEKVGVIDIQSVFERSRTGKGAVEALLAEFGAQRRLLVEEESALKDEAAELERARGTVPADQLRLRTERYLARLERYRIQVQTFNQDLSRRHRALVNEYLPRIIAAAKPLAEREGFATVLHQGRAETVLIVYYRAPEIDLTDRVIELLDRDYRP